MYKKTLKIFIDPPPMVFLSLTITGHDSVISGHMFITQSTEIHTLGNFSHQVESVGHTAYGDW